MLSPTARKVVERAPDFVAITGDIAFSGKPEEYDLAHVVVARHQEQAFQRQVAATGKQVPGEPGEIGYNGNGNQRDEVGHLVFKKILSALKPKNKKQNLHSEVEGLKTALSRLTTKANDVRMILSRAQAKEEMTRETLDATQGKLQLLQEKAQSSGDDSMAPLITHSQQALETLNLRLVEEQKHRAALEAAHQQIQTLLLGIRNQMERHEARRLSAEARKETYELAGKVYHQNGLMDEMSDRVLDLESECEAVRALLPDEVQWDLDFKDLGGR